jgi:type I restriction enzyme S subunit
MQTARELGAVVVPAGSILLPKIGAALLGNARRVTTRSTVFDNNVLGVIPRGIYSGYLYYWLSTVDLAELANPGPVPSLADSAILDLPVPCVDPLMQRAIADLLDTEIARIDTLIAKKRVIKERLAERRAAVSYAGITGDLLYSDSERVDSRLPWLTSYPAGWRTVKLTLVATLGSGHTPSRDHPEWWLDCSVPWITTGEVAQMRDDRIEYITRTREMISELGIANSSATVHPAGTVVLSRTASAGFSAIMCADMATSQDFATWTCGPLLEPRFLLLCLRVMRNDLLNRLAQGSTHKTIYMPDIESIRIPLPATGEQQAIVEDIWRRLRPIDEIDGCLERQIARLEERRTALIEAAVTGELEVPGVSA